jgi:glutamate decarboxylase
MALSQHVDADKLIREASDHHIKKHAGNRSVHHHAHVCRKSACSPQGPALGTPLLCSDRAHQLIRHRQDLHDIPYASRYDVDQELPRFQMPDKGVDSKVAYQILHDELELGTSNTPRAVQAAC